MKRQEKASILLEQRVGRFTRTSGWAPALVHHVAGAIRYSHNDVLKRLPLKFSAYRAVISKR